MVGRQGWSRLVQCTVKPAQAATSIKRAPPLNGHLNPPRMISYANAPVLSKHLSNVGNGQANLSHFAKSPPLSKRFSGGIVLFSVC